MVRIAPLLDAHAGPEHLVSAIRTRRGGQLLNLDRVLLHSPALAQGWNAHLGAVRTGLALPAKLRELVICAVAVLNHADYEFAQHAPEFLRAGGSPAALQALRDYDAACDAAQFFDDVECAALRLTREMTRQVAVTDDTFELVRAVLGNERHVVELIGVVATYNMVSRFLVALEVASE
jgi:alkylhydroperoxidase family enzyme